MTFSEWFGEHWRQPDESPYAAAVRLSGAAGISPPTAIRLVKGLPVQFTTARIVAELTDGRVDPTTLVKKSALDREPV